MLRNLLDQRRYPPLVEEGRLAARLETQETPKATSPLACGVSRRLLRNLLDQRAPSSTPEPGLPAPSGRRLPRALTPFRHPSYRRLGTALVLQTFASGVWVVALVW
ncbi:MAG: hypothetical protein NTX33_02915 [Propionibacteriales bacterium]|nr:hypothetical protein [Propionibacteriales bacterium]